MTGSQPALPSYGGAEVVVPAPGPGPGSWAGAASAVRVGGTVWLTWRVRRPLGEGRGVSVVVARSVDGVHFQQVTEVGREPFGAESLERPALVPLPTGGWRLYLSCATPGSKHWWVASVAAATVEDLPAAIPHVVLPGDEHTGVKDPVVTLRHDRNGVEWEMWLCCHPLDLPGEEDRMTSRHLRSRDGLRWSDHGEVLAGRPGHWDARGARVTTVLTHDPLTVLYDGRPDAASNWHEATGLARLEGGRLVPVDEAGVISSPYGDGAFRYATSVPAAAARTRFYVEAARPDGAHDLITLVR